MVVVTEHYRPKEEHDQMLMCIDGIDYVKGPIHPITWLATRVDGVTCAPWREKVIIKNLDIKELPDIINDILCHLLQMEQPCNLSIYALDVTNLSMMQVVIRDILH